jgi:hypothetical protein
MTSLQELNSDRKVAKNAKFFPIFLCAFALRISPFAVESLINKPPII